MWWGAAMFGIGSPVHGKKGIQDESGPQAFVAAGTMFCRAAKGAGMDFTSFVGVFDTGAFTIAIDIEVDAVLSLGIAAGDKLLISDFWVWCQTWRRCVRTAREGVSKLATNKAEGRETLIGFTGFARASLGMDRVCVGNFWV
jgi:hypothetical protein